MGMKRKELKQSNRCRDSSEGEPHEHGDNSCDQENDSNVSETVGGHKDREEVDINRSLNDVLILSHLTDKYNRF